jgi:uncharacterized membrane protein required for colicin V production
MAVDLIVALLLAGGFLLGFVRGAIRQLVACGACLVLFLLAAHLSTPVGRWLAGQSPVYTTDYAVMLSFGAMFVVGLAIALVVIEVTGTTVTLTRHVLFDNILGAVLGVVLVVLTLSFVLVVLDTYYTLPEQSGDTIAIIGDLYRVTLGSISAEFLRDNLIPVMGGVLSALLPDHVRAVMT